MKVKVVSVTQMREGRDFKIHLDCGHFILALTRKRPSPPSHMDCGFCRPEGGLTKLEHNAYSHRQEIY